MISRQLVIGLIVMVAVVVIMGLYVGHMRHRVTDLQPTQTDSRPLTPPVSGPTESVTLYVAYDDPGTIRATTTRVPLSSARQQRAEQLLRALMAIYLDQASQHPLAAGSEVKSVYLVDPGVAVIDVNAAFADGHRSGILVEELTVASMIQTLSANIQGISRVKILIDGKTRDTLAGHIDLSSPYETSSVNQLVQQLQSGF